MIKRSEKSIVSPFQFKLIFSSKNQEKDPSSFDGFKGECGVIQEEQEEIQEEEEEVELILKEVEMWSPLKKNEEFVKEVIMWIKIVSFEGNLNVLKK